MTNRFKDFGQGGEVNKAPLSFKLHGEEFHCREAIQGKTLLDLVASSDAESTSDVADTINRFFKLTLNEESYPRFNALLTNPDTIVTVETLGDITAWLVEEYSSRPTPQPEPSLSGQ